MTTALLAAAGALLFATDGSAAVGFGATINVTTANDEFGTVPGNCSLREAVQTANTNADFGGCTHTGNFATGPNSDVVQLPAANPGYALARTGAEDDTNVLGDIDIASNITIQGAGAGTTPIFVCGGCADRVVEVVSGTNVDINDVTLKFGHPSGPGGGMFVAAGSVVTLTRVTIGLNTTEGNGGGIFNRGTLTINESAIGNNVTLGATLGGGGIFNDDVATLTLNDSRVLANRTEGNGADGDGAGIYNAGTLALDNTTVDANIVAVGGTAGSGTDALVDGDGGGIATSGPTTIIDSTISNNVAAGNNAVGGGIFCSSGLLTILRTVIFNNRADPNPDASADATSAGGVFSQCGTTLIEDSVISSNSAESGGGIKARVLRLNRSTVVANTADEGGGLSTALDRFQSSLAGLDHAITNTTFINNTATGDGGGLYYVRFPNVSNKVALSNVTIVGNVSNQGGFGGGDGGGLRVEFFDEDDPLFLKNSVIAGNSAGGDGVGDDCFASDGNLISLGHNLIQSSDGGCAISDADDQAGINPKLAAAGNNGGPIAGATSGVMAGMLTRAPLADSPLVDAGTEAGCKDGAGALLATDQVGRARAIDGDVDGIARCDIGAIELSFSIFDDSYE